MTEQEVKALLIKYEKKECTPAERMLVDGWYSQTLDTKKLPEGKIDFDAVGAEMWKNMDLSALKAEPRKLRLWPRISVTAAAALAVVFGLWYDHARHTAGPEIKAQLTSDIAPGKNKASLILANGKVVDLSENQKSVMIRAGKLSYNDGTEVSSLLRNVATVNTPRGGTYQITLADGTKVWLNAASTLKFPSGFTGAAQRKVTLSGEAYFEVAKVTDHNRRVPFIVESKGQQVEVLGTHFNISSYDEEETVKTTLLEGSVKVNQQILTPGHEAILTHDRQIRINKVDADDAIDWKNGEFVCKNEPLNQIMRKLARWYDVEVVYTNPKLKNLTFSGSLSRYDQVSGVLNALEQAGTIRFKLEGRKIQVL